MTEWIPVDDRKPADTKAVHVQWRDCGDHSLGPVNEGLAHWKEYDSKWDDLHDATLYEQVGADYVIVAWAPMVWPEEQRNDVPPGVAEMEADNRAYQLVVKLEHAHARIAALEAGLRRLSEAIKLWRSTEGWYALEKTEVIDELRAQLGEIAAALVATDVLLAEGTPAKQETKTTTPCGNADSGYSISAEAYRMVIAERDKEIEALKREIAKLDVLYFEQSDEYVRQSPDGKLHGVPTTVEVEAQRKRADMECNRADAEYKRADRLLAELNALRTTKYEPSEAAFQAYMDAMLGETPETRRVNREPYRDGAMRYLRAAWRAQQPPTPEGYALVPREPSNEICTVMDEAFSKAVSRDMYGNVLWTFVYRAMILKAEEGK